MIEVLPPLWLMRLAVAAVWLYEGLWCKLLGGAPDQRDLIESVPGVGSRFGGIFLRSLGLVETVLAGWVLSAGSPRACALAQTVLLVALNSGGLLFGRNRIHDPGGMVVKNFAFLVLAWTAAALSGGGSP